MPPRRRRNSSVPTVDTSITHRTVKFLYEYQKYVPIIISILLVLFAAIFYHSAVYEKYEVKSNIDINEIKKHLSEISYIFQVYKNKVSDMRPAGGYVIDRKDPETHNKKSNALFGIPLCATGNYPNALIQPGVMPGECWAFKEQGGSAVVRLATKIYVTAVSVEHLPRNITLGGEMSTAPKEFSIWGLKSPADEEGFCFGRFTYDIKGTAVQYFPVVHKAFTTFDILELRVHSNHEHPEYTCIYRIRVYGDPEKR